LCVSMLTRSEDLAWFRIAGIAVLFSNMMQARAAEVRSAAAVDCNPSPRKLTSLAACAHTYRAVRRDGAVPATILEHRVGLAASHVPSTHAYAAERRNLGPDSAACLLNHL
jgi:hypothetical protein